MTTDEKLAAILAAVQTDPGGRGLARDPHDNLFLATQADFAAACRSLATTPRPHLALSTGFYIPTATPPAYETDGPPGVVFLARACAALGWPVTLHLERPLERVVRIGLTDQPIDNERAGQCRPTHHVWIERVGPAADGRCYSMRGQDVTAFHEPLAPLPDTLSIGIGDGGNEIGMGKVPHQTVVKNILAGRQIHCRVPTDFLIVCGVSNWGAYALAAGLFLLLGIRPPAGLFDLQRERETLQAMVRGGPLVDGVSGRTAVTVDGLAWDEYVRPLHQIREIVGG